MTAPGVTVNLNGFTLTGSGGNGVAILPKAVGAWITSSTSGATITGFDIGVLDEASSARIENLTISSNSNTGVEVAGSGSGAEPLVDGSVIAGNLIQGNGNYGVYLQNTKHCLVDRNEQISGISGSVTKVGVWVQNTYTPPSGAPPVMADNVITWNELNLISDTRIDVGYTGSANATCTPPVAYPPPSEGDVIADNQVPNDTTGNGLFGIGLECLTGEDDAVHGNDAASSGTTDDLYDGNVPSCDGNVWSGNTFSTANLSVTPTCIN